MATNNSINLKDAGVVSYDGSGTFSGSLITQYNTLVAGSDNSITSVPPSTAGFVLTSNGPSANPSFQLNSATSGITSINIQTFTSSGTYTPTSGMIQCVIESIGGGGGGGGVNNGGAFSPWLAGGGSGACYVKALFTAATIGASQTVTIGAGGAGGTAGGGNGGNGGTTTVGSLISSGPGIGCVGQPTYFPSYSGSIGSNTGSATGHVPGSLVIIPGGNASAGVVAGGNQPSPSGNGADSYFGTGGYGTFTEGTAFSGVGYGSGGAGAANPNIVASAGGDGAPGFVVITEYISI